MTRSLEQPSASSALAGALLLALLVSACFNDSFQNVYRGPGTGRFSLVVEPGRTDLRGTHFLVDTATGDTWRLEARSDTAGDWRRVADGPTDLTPLRPAAEPDEEHEE